MLNVGEELSTLRDAVISFVGKRELLYTTRMQTDFMKKLLSDAKTQELLDDAKKTCSIKDESISVYESVYGAKKPTSTFSFNSRAYKAEQHTHLWKHPMVTTCLCGFL